MGETIGEGLIRLGIMTKDQVDDVLKKQKEGDARRFGDLAIGLGHISKADLQSYLGSAPG